MSCTTSGGLRVRLAAFTLALVSALIASTAGASAQTDKVKTDKGTVEGNETRLGAEYLGIPYAKPPVGKMRWKAPAPAKRFKGILDATEVRSPCLQDDTEVTDSRLGSEDCLFLNVYAPKKAKGKLPVMVWFHGGAFINGSGNIYNGSKLANTANAIVVTVNYRLGPFGWLALPGLAAERSDGSTGNYGLMDQQAALRWVKSNIGGFGGQSKNVTIFGQSAGGEAGFAHLTSPASQGLFSKVITQSGPVTLRFPTKDAAYEKYAPVAARAGCPSGGDPAAQVACLRKAKANKVLSAADETWDLVSRLGLDWTPTNDGALLPAPFQDMLAEGNFAQVPVMVGATAHEGKLFIGIYENNIGRAATDADIFERLNAFFAALSGLPESTTATITRNTIDRYAADPRYPTPGLQGAGIVTDALFSCSQATLRDSLSAKVPTYGYEFDDPNTPDVEIDAKFIDLGSAHDSELPYLFQIDPDTGKPPKLNKRQRALGVQMGEYWGQFARTGNPNGKGLPTWSPWQADSGIAQSLQPGGSVGLAPGAFETEHQCSYWNALLGAIG